MLVLVKTEKGAITLFYYDSAVSVRLYYYKNYPGDSIDCQLELSLQYLYSGRNDTCLSAKNTNTLESREAETIRPFFDRVTPNPPALYKPDVSSS